MSYDESENKKGDKQRGSSPAARGSAGVYIEGELGAFYLLAMLAHSEPRGLPNTRVERVRFQGAEFGYALDDLIIHGRNAGGENLLEIQSKRTITFARSDREFEEVCEQIAKTANQSIPEEHHFFAVATQRTSKAISGPYQDVLYWAHVADSGAEFFLRLSARGVASDSMRGFIAVFRTHLVAAGISDDDEAIWRVLRQFQILEFDFESTASIARIYALLLAGQALLNEDSSRAPVLWSNLIEISIATARAGGSIDLETLSRELAARGFRLAGDRNFSAARAKLAEMAGHALANIGTTVAGIRLPRLAPLAAVDEGLDHHRFIEIRGTSGVGKSSVLRGVAERLSRQSHIIVLDPVATPQGGWGAYAQSLGLAGTAKAFLGDLAASGGGVLFIDSLEMFTEPGRQRTVNDLLREVSAIDGFSVIATARADFGKDGEAWLAEDALARLGASHVVTVEDLNDSEIDILIDHAPALRALLAPNQPAAPIARNLYRLSRLLKVPSAADVQTEAALAAFWWRTADGASGSNMRAAQRILADLADIALKGEDVLKLQTDSGARSHLLNSLTLREVRRDHLAFYHDVLRDWAVSSRIHEDLSRVAALDLTVPVSPRIARGIELAGRLTLEMRTDYSSWLQLLILLSPVGAHGSWRRQALLALVRSELAAALLERCSAALLAKGGAVLRELCTAIVAVETVALADLMKTVPGSKIQATVPRSVRTNTTESATWLMLWCVGHAAEIPMQAIGATIDLIEIQYFALMRLPPLAELVAKMLFGWLLQLDTHGTGRTIPVDDSVARLDRNAYNTLVGDLRTWAFLLAGHAADEAKAYLRAITAEHDIFKRREIRKFSGSLAPVAPAELADMVASSLIQSEERTSSRRRPLERAFSFIDNDFLPPSPAQPPFFDLLEASPEIGLALIRQLTQEAVAYHSQSANVGANGFTLELERGPRFFPWTQTYFWSRDQACEYSVASALKALEAWGHIRLDTGDSAEAVLADVLGPEGSCAAYLLVAVDLLISHWPATRGALVPFLASPHLLATERGRQARDLLDRVSSGLGREPSGKVQLADLAARPSRGAPLENALVGYVDSDAASDRLREQLRVAVEALNAFGEDANFSDPAFMGSHALHVLNPENWIEGQGGGRAYRSPPPEAEHMARLGERANRLNRSSDIEARIQLAIGDLERGSAELALQAVEYVIALPPAAVDDDAARRQSTQLISTALLVARDGDDALLDAQEHWGRAAIGVALSEKPDRLEGSSDQLLFNRSALAGCALAYLWHRKRLAADLDALIVVAIRPDRSAPTAFAAVRNIILATDWRVLKAAMRAAFTSCRWRWRPWNEDTSVQQRFEEEKAAADQRAVAAEIAWLDGGPEPEWPPFPEERPNIRRHVRLRVPGEAASEHNHADGYPTTGGASIHAERQTAARWVRLLTTGREPEIAWRDEIVNAYAAWSAGINGYGLPQESEISDRHTDWNNQFYALLGIVLIDGSRLDFDQQLEKVTSLPDQPFLDIAEALIHSADMTYFNEAHRSPERAVKLRARLVERTQKVFGWTQQSRPGDLSVDRDMAGAVAHLLMNNYSPFSQTQSYLVPAVFDRVDSLLGPLQPLLPGGPTAFVALCTMNTLLVAPRARHIDFLLLAAEAWHERFPRDQAIWLALGIGNKIVDWFERAIVEEPSLLSRGHLHSARIDLLFGRLVDLGVPEAHEMEIRIERERSA